MSISLYPAIEAQFKKCLAAMNSFNFTEAYLHLQAAYQPLSRLGPKHSKWAEYYLHLAAIYNNSGKFKESIECCQSAQQIIKKQRQRQIEAKLFSILAGSYLNLSVYNQH